MGERLDAGDEFYAPLRGVRIDPAEVLDRILAAAIAEIRLPLDLVGVLRIEHERLVAHPREQINIAFQCRSVHDCPAGAVEHHAETERLRFHNRYSLFPVAVENRF